MSSFDKNDMKSEQVVDNAQPLGKPTEVLRVMGKLMDMLFFCCHVSGVEENMCYLSFSSLLHVSYSSARFVSWLRIECYYRR